MVAYSFQQQFVTPIRLGLSCDYERGGVVPKRHTIRADRRRHARPGEEVQLYRGMRTKGCFLIGRGRCTATKKIELVFRGRGLGVWIDDVRAYASRKDRDRFARSDGFENWPALAEFWKENHNDPDVWKGVIVYWEPLS